MGRGGGNVASFPNIAAFKVNEKTRREARDLFSAMTTTWGYLLNNSEKRKYREAILQNYSEKHLQLFDKVEILQRHTCLQKKITEHYGKDSGYLKMKWLNSKKTFLYGAGYYANLYYQYGMLNGLNINGFVISDDQEKVSDRHVGLPVYFLAELPCKPEECDIIVAVEQRYQKLILLNLKRAGYYNIL